MQLCLYDDLDGGTGVGWAARYKREGTDAYIELTHFTVEQNYHSTENQLHADKNKTTVRYHFIPVRMAITKNGYYLFQEVKSFQEDMEKREHLGTVGGNGN